MAGGTWVDQNKVRPGIYINYSSKPSSLSTMGDRGIVCIAKDLDWGEMGKVITIEDPAECFDKLGYDQTEESMTWLRQMLLGTNRTSGASKVIVWRLTHTSSMPAEGSQTSSGSTLKAIAKYGGERGNDISVVVTADPDNSETKCTYYVQTFVGSVVVDTQTLTANDETVPLSGLQNNQWVTFATKTGNAFATSITLSGGTAGTRASTAYSDFMSAMELENWNIIAYGGDDAVVKSAVASFAKRMSNDEGKKVQACIWDYPSPDTECAISVNSQHITENSGHELSNEEMVCWVAGCTAGATASQSLTYAAHPDAKTLSPILTNSQQVEAINNGQFAFIEEFGSIKCLQDNNTFKTFSATKGKAFRKNRVIRTVFGLANDIYKAFSQYYIGNTDNDDFGRSLLKAEILNLMNRYQGARALTNVISDDVTVEKGAESDSVVIEINCQPIDSIEKIYINITIS